MLDFGRRTKARIAVVATLINMHVTWAELAAICAWRLAGPWGAQASDASPWRPTPHHGFRRLTMASKSSRQDYAEGDLLDMDLFLYRRRDYAAHITFHIRWHPHTRFQKHKSTSVGIIITHHAA